MRRVAGSQARQQILGGALLAFGAAAGVAACASARPEQRLAVADADGRRVSFDSATTRFDVDGVRVIHRPNHGTEVVAVNLYLLGGTRQLDAGTQGVEALLVRAGEYGSAAYPGEAQRAAWGRTGSVLVASTDADWTLYGFRGVRDEFDASWNVWADRLLRPTLAEHDLAVVRARLVSRARRRRADPDGLAMLAADSVAFAGHPYALDPAGTERTLAGLDSAAVRRYADAQLVRSRLLVVVVGNIERARIEAAVRRTLTGLPQGRYVWTLPPAAPAQAQAAARQGAATLVARPFATNYVLGVFHGPLASSPDAPAFRVAAALLGGRLHYAVREQRGLSYAASAPFLDRGATGAMLYVSTTQPRQVLDVARAQLDTLRREPYPPGAMRYFADQFVTEYLAENMTSAAQAAGLAHAELYEGDYRRATRTMDALRGLTSNEVRTAAGRYLRRPHWVYLGDTTRVTREAFRAF
jgi:zinc protease